MCFPVWEICVFPAWLGSNHHRLCMFLDTQVIKLFKLERTLKGHLMQLPAMHGGTYLLHEVLKALCRLTLSVAKDGASH